MGEEERKQAKIESAELGTKAEEFLTLPGEPALFRYRFDPSELLPVPWAGEAPREAVRRLVLGQGEKSLTLAGLQMVPVLSFSALEASQDVPLAVTAVLQEKPGGFGEFVGKQVLLLGRAGKQGLSGLRRLPLVIRHEADRREVELDQEAGVLLVPEAALVEDLEVLALKEQRFAVYFKLSYAPEGTEKAQAQGFYFAPTFLALCTPKACELTPLRGEELSQKMRHVHGGEAWVGVMSVLKGFTSQSTLAFSAHCHEPQTKKPLGPCFALFSWAP